MILLSDASLDYAFNVCKERAHYKVVIVCKDNEAYRARSRIYLRALADDDAIESTNICRDRFIVHFKNGSYIRLFVCSSSTQRTEIGRGHRADLLVADYGIDRDALVTIFRPMDREDWTWYEVQHRERGDT